MTRHSQKLDEKALAERLIRRLGFPFTTVECPNDPNIGPDVAVNIGDTLIGIEVTRYDGGPNAPDVLKENLFCKLCRELDQLIKTRDDLRGLDINLFSAAAPRLSQRTVKACAEQTFGQIVQQKDRFSGQSTFLRLDASARRVFRAIEVNLMPDELAKIHLPVHSDLDAAWTGVPKEAIARIIRKKSDCTRTEEHCGRPWDEVWLLIADGPGFRANLNSPTIYEFDRFEEIGRDLRLSAFSRCYLLCDNSAVFELTESGMKQRALYHGL